MEIVTLKPLQHRGVECIGIYSPPNATFNHYYQKKQGPGGAEHVNAGIYPAPKKITNNWQKY